MCAQPIFYTCKMYHIFTCTYYLCILVVHVLHLYLHHHHSSMKNRTELNIELNIISQNTSQKNGPDPLGWQNLKFCKFCRSTIKIKIKKKNDPTVAHLISNDMEQKTDNKDGDGGGNRGLTLTDYFFPNSQSSSLVCDSPSDDDDDKLVPPFLSSWSCALSPGNVFIVVSISVICLYNFFI